MNSNVKEEIEKYWEERESLKFSDPDIKKNIFSVLQLLDSGEIRVCEKKNDNWITNEWIKKESYFHLKLKIMLSFPVGFQIRERANIAGLIKFILKHLAGSKMNGQKEALDLFLEQ